MPEMTVRPGQIWGDAADSRKLVVEHVDGRYAYYHDVDSSRKGRIQLRRLRGSKKYYLRTDSRASGVEMKTLQVDLRNRDPIFVQCDKYEEKKIRQGKVAELWLILHRDENQVGRYRMAEVVGYHEM